MAYLTNFVQLCHFFVSGPGVYYGSVDVTGAVGENTVTKDTKLIQYPFWHHILYVDLNYHETKNSFSIIIPAF